MPQSRFREDLQQEIPRWVNEGIISRDQGERIVRRYPFSTTSTSQEPSWVIQLLYATAGVLVGAAVVAVLVVGLKIDEAPPFLIAAGALLAIAVAAQFLLPKTRLLAADAIYAASLVPMCLAVFQADYAGFTTLVVSLGMLWWRRERGSLQALASIAYSVAAFGTFFEFFQGFDTGGWAIAQVLLLAAVVVIDAVGKKESSMAAGFVAVGAFAASAAAYLGDDIVDSSELVEIILMVLMLLLGALGFFLGHRGILTGAATVLAVTAIVFAFDVGGWIFGVIVLLAVAGLLIWQAETLRRYFRTPAG